MSGPEGVRLVPIVDGDGAEVLSGGAGFVGGDYKRVGLSRSAAYARRRQDWQDDRDAEQYEEQRVAALASHRSTAVALGVGSPGRSHAEVLAGLVDGDRRRTLADERSVERQAEWEGRPTERSLYEERRRRAAQESAARVAESERTPASKSDLGRLKAEVAALGVKLGRLGG